MMTFAANHPYELLSYDTQRSDSEQFLTVLRSPLGLQTIV